MAFRFRLESVLSYRQQLEDALQLQLARLEHTYRTEQQVLDDLQARKESQMNRMLDRQRAGRHLDVQELVEGFAYLEALEVSLEQQTGLLATLAAQLEEKRGEVVQAMQERKALENLKDRERQRHLTWLNQVEGRLLDEVATIQHNRRLSAAAQEGESIAQQ